MNNPLKNNPLAAGLFGYVMGIFKLLGGQAIVKDSNRSDTPVSSFYSSTPTDLSFHGLEQNDGGDVAITKTGDCYHSLYGCPHLNRATKIRVVNREDADTTCIVPQTSMTII